MEHAELLSVLSQAGKTALRDLSEQVLSKLGDLEVLENQTGLVMLPYRDTVEGVAFHLGEVLVAQAHIRQQDLQGYGMVLGRDLEHAMQVAVLDLGWQKGIFKAEIEQLVKSEKAEQDLQDQLLLRHVEATRVEMETF